MNNYYDHELSVLKTIMRIVVVACLTWMTVTII